MAISDYIEDLIYRVLAGEASEEERQELEKWLRESEEHQSSFREIERAWYTGRYAVRWKNVETGAGWQAVERKRGRRRRGRVARIGWSVAAVVALVFGLTRVFLPTGGELPVAANQSPVGNPGEAKAVLVLSSGVKVALGHESADTIREKGMPILNERDYIDYSRTDTAAVDEIVYNELIVPTGGEYRLYLSDGTLVYMNSESKLRYPIRFSKGNRFVELEGEAYFEVSRDESHPFVVRAGQLDVKVLGTGFNVMAYPGEWQAEVTLVRGKVDVRRGNESCILKPDDQYVLDKKEMSSVVQKVDTDIYTSWKDGILNFDALPLEQLAKKLGRWYKVEFVFGDDWLKKLKFSGAFKKDNNIRYVLSLIEATTEVQFEIKGDTVMVQRK